MKKTVVLLMTILMMAALFVGCSPEQKPEATPEATAAPEDATEEPVVESDPTEYLNGKTIRVVIGSTSVTGDTYLTAELVSRMISQNYNCDIQVDPIGSGRALEEIVSTDPDGSTIMMFHDMTYLGVLYGAFAEEDYKLENMVVGGSYGYNPGDCFAASASAPYKSIKEMADWMQENPSEVVKLAVEAGGVSQLGFNGIYLWIKEAYGEDVSSRLKAFVTGSTEEKLQALWDGNCQGIYAAASSIEQYTLEGVEDQLKVNIIGLMGNSIEGKEWPTFAEQGITMNGEPFVFTKEYFAFYPVGIPNEYVAAMDAAMEAVCNSDEYKAAIEQLGYKAQYLDSSDAQTHIFEKREAYRKLIEDAPSFDDLEG
ncbi:MAG: hypothetical protein JW976_12140 [Syntrophaceae bacterium]|nr:hypothetical protein [Syntrophaceae bacterium]